MLDSKIMTFIKVVELKSYTKAAEALHLTQPAVTQHIKKLELYYKCSLFQINGKAISLTENGEILYQTSLQQSNNEKHMVSQMNKESLTIKIGATLSIADYYLPRYLKVYMQEAKDNFSITVRNTRALLNQLLEGSLHCALIEGDFDENLFEAHEFCKTDFIAVVRSGHPLLNQSVSLKDCLSYPLILREEGSGTRGILEHYLLHKRVTINSFPKIDEIGSFVMIKTLLEHTDGLSFMYKDVCIKEMQEKKLEQLQVIDFSMTRTLYFIYPKNSVLKERYIRFFKKLIQES